MSKMWGLRKSESKIQKHKTKTKTVTWYPPAVPPPTPKYKSTTSHVSHTHIISNNNTIDIAFLVQMRQCNKCRSVRNVEIINIHLESGAGIWARIPCLLQDTSHMYWFHLPKTSNKENTKNWEMRSNFQKIVSYCFGLCGQNPGLRKVDLEPSPKRGSDKINMQKQGRNIQNKASCIV